MYCHVFTNAPIGRHQNAMPRCDTSSRSIPSVSPCVLWSHIENVLRRTHAICGQLHYFFSCCRDKRITIIAASILAMRILLFDRLPVERDRGLCDLSARRVLIKVITFLILLHTHARTLRTYTARAKTSHTDGKKLDFPEI